jgi:NAD(P)-dependent dehydrogenase (short-subunit alcohol dehydrogenase family)
VEGAVADTDRLVAVVTGASRGVGKGIAAVLGEAGAVVYVTGRSVRGQPSTEGLPGTIEDTADLVTKRGGRGIAVRCDHTKDQEVEALFERVRREQSCLHLLVNNAWGGYERHPGAGFAGPIWQQPLQHWDGMFTAGLRSHFTAIRLAAPLLTSDRGGAQPRLVVNTMAWAFDSYLGNLFFDVANGAILRMTRGLAVELRPFEAAAVAVAPGFVRTERVQAQAKQQPLDLSKTESPEYIGRAVATLAHDPEVIEKSGRLLLVGELAREYGFTDLDGKQPAPFKLPT